MRSVLIGLIAVWSMCFSGTAFCQPMADGSTSGRLVIRYPEDGECVDASALGYRRLGAVFHMKPGGEGIAEVLVSDPTDEGIASANAGGPEYIVPGESAYGIALGMTREQVRLKACPQRSAEEFADLDSAYCHLGPARTLYVFFTEDVVSQLLASGRFKTPEGVTEDSTVSDIRKAYGAPDRCYELNRGGGNPAWGMLPFLLMPSLGVMTGLALRRVRRHRAQAGTGLLLHAAVLGALALSATAAASTVLTSWLVDKVVGWQLLPLILTVAAVSGGGSTLLLVALNDRLCSGLRGVLLLVLMAAVVFVSGIAIAMLWPARAVSPFTLMPLAVNNLLFVIGMFLVGRTKRQPGPD